MPGIYTYDHSSAIRTTYPDKLMALARRKLLFVRSVEHALDALVSTTRLKQVLYPNACGAPSSILVCAISHRYSLLTLRGTPCSPCSVILAQCKSTPPHPTPTLLNITSTHRQWNSLPAHSYFILFIFLSVSRCPSYDKVCLLQLLPLSLFACTISNYSCLLVLCAHPCWHSVLTLVAHPRWHPVLILFGTPCSPSLVLRSQ